MKKYIFENRDLTKQFAVITGILALIFRLCLSYTQYATVYPPLAPIDDDLMTKRAMSVASGGWLGEYTYLTISKHAFFAVWLAFLHIIGMPYLVGNMLLWAFASLCAILAVKPVIRKRYQLLIIFIGLLYNPAACRQYATRIYRDAIFPSLCLVFFAGIIGVGLRYKNDIKSWLGFTAMYGISFGCIYLCREDGIWVLPFCVAAFVIVTALLILEKKPFAKKIFAMVIPFSLSAVIICLYCYENYTHYGRFIVSDFTSSDFKAAYGAMTSLKQDSWDAMVDVPRDVREDLYENIEDFAPVKEALTEPLLMVGYYSETHDDFTSGSFYWALRRALASLGVYENAGTAQEYYENLTDEIQALVNDGTLETTDGGTKLRKSVTPPIRAEYIAPVLKETFSGLKCAILFEQCDPLAERAVGTDEEITETERFIHQGSNRAYIRGTDEEYISPLRQITHTILRIVRAVYMVMIPLMCAVTLIWQGKTLYSDITEKRLSENGFLNIILLGVLGMALLRCAMIAFVEVSSFGIGTYVMYLSTVHPLLILYGFTGCAKTFEY